MTAARKDSGTSYTTQSLKKALASAKVQKALEELNESAKAFEGDAEISKVFSDARQEIEKLIRVLESE